MRSVSAFLLTFVLFCAEPLYAEPLSCLADAKGKTLLWSGGWESDGADDGVPYRVLEVSTRYSYPAQTESVVLILSSAVQAKMPYRKLQIRGNAQAASVCRALHERAALPERAAARPHKETAAAAQSAPPDLPFIAYSADGWVRADRPQQGSFEICRVLLRPFLCRREDRATHGAELPRLEEELLWEQDSSPS